MDKLERQRLKESAKSKAMKEPIPFMVAPISGIFAALFVGNIVITLLFTIFTYFPLGIQAISINAVLFILPYVIYKGNRKKWVEKREREIYEDLLTEHEDK